MVSGAAVDPAMARTITGIVRDAYSAGDLVPGLPVADGARVGPAELYADLDAGHLLWVARFEGRIAGTVRAVRRTDGWGVRRLAVASWCRRAGLATGLMRRLEEDAVAAGVTQVSLDAVVERGNPAFYARLGYRSVRHFGADDKPLSEVHMLRDPRSAPVPAPHDVPPRAPGLTLSWVPTASGTACRFGVAEGALGADFLPDGGPAEKVAVQAALGGFTFDLPAAEISAFRMPRLVHGRLLAWWRSPAVRRQADPAR